MPDDCITGLILEAVVSGCSIKAVKLDADKGGSLLVPLPPKLKAKFGTLPRCDYYLVAQEGEVLALIEETNLSRSIEKAQENYADNLKQILKKASNFKVSRAYKETEGYKFFWELAFNEIYVEHCEKALATLYILEYMRQCGTDSNLRCILDYKRVAYVLLFPKKIKGALVQREVIANIRNSLLKASIIKKNFLATTKRNFCQDMHKKILNDAKFLRSGTK